VPYAVKCWPAGADFMSRQGVGASVRAGSRFFVLWRSEELIRGGCSH